MKPVTLTETIKRHGVVDGDDFFGLWTRRGPADYRKLWKANYGANPETGEKFHQATTPQTIRLVNYGVLNRADETNAPIIEAIHHYKLTGRSLLLGDGSRELYAIDNPPKELIGHVGRRVLINDEETLELEGFIRKYKQQLGKIEEGGVVFSPDRRIRFTTLDKIKEGRQTFKRFAVNPGNVLISGSLENAELNAQTAKIYEMTPRLSLHFYEWGPAVLITSFGSSGFDFGLHIGGFNSMGSGRCAFGVCKNVVEGSAPKNNSPVDSQRS